MIRNSAAVEQIKPGVISRSRIQMGVRMPGIDRRAVGRCLALVGSVPNEVDEGAVIAEIAGVDLLDRVSHAISGIPGPCM